MKKIFLFTIAVCHFTFNAAFSQNVGVNLTGATPNVSAGLDVDFSNMGVLIPRVTLTQTSLASPITSPATSLVVYNTATANDVTPGFYYWDGAKWLRLLNGTGSGAAWITNGNALTGTLPSSPNEFIGTTNNADWIIKTNNSEIMRVTAGGSVGIGTNSPSGTLHVAGAIPNYIDRASNVANEGANFIFRKARGTISSPAAVQNGDELAKWLCGGYDGSAYIFTGGMSAVVSGAVSSGTIPTDLVFGVNNVSMGNPTSNETMRITYGKNVGIGTTAPLSKLEVIGAAPASSFIERITNQTADGEYFGCFNYLGNEAISLRQDVNGHNVIAINNSAGTRNVQFSSVVESYINSGANFGIGTVTPLYPVDVNGDIRARGNMYAGYESGVSGGVFITKTSTYGLPSVQSVTTGFAPANLLINPVGLNVGVGGVSAPTSVLDIQGGSGYNTLRVRASYTPTSTADANGNTGDICWDANYFYVKTNAGWKRTVLSAF